MEIDWGHDFINPAPQLSFYPRTKYDLFNATHRDGYNPHYDGPPDEPGHNGVDLYAPRDSDALASHDGRVEWAGRKEGNTAAGIFVEVLERDGLNNGWWLTRYLHLDSVDVQPGDQVLQGTRIGGVGNTGANSPHIHFEIRWKPGDAPGYTPGSGVQWGIKIDPLSFGILGSIWPVYLRRGDRDPDSVPILASLLVALGYRKRCRATYAVYGRYMERQVKRFQEDQALTADGIVGPVTLDAMYAAIAATR
jgi:murein DD-endopeptidase MepM/ murein hydrolase activator NlpD